MSVRTVLTVLALPIAAASLALLGAGPAAASTTAATFPSVAWTVSVGVDGAPAAHAQRFGELAGLEIVEINGAAGGVVQQVIRSDDPGHARIADRTTENLTVTVSRVQPDGSTTVVVHGHLTPDSTLVFDPDGR